MRHDDVSGHSRVRVAVNAALNIPTLNKDAQNILTR
jgi:hypothetical protein